VPNIQPDGEDWGLPGGNDWGALLHSSLDKILSSQRADGAYPFYAAGDGQQPFMVGLLNDALMEYYTKFEADPRILGAVKKSLDYVWAHQWDATAQAFVYSEAEPIPAPDLNNLVSSGFGWVYAMTGDETYKERGDQVFAGGVNGAWLDGSKQFNQQYQSSLKYLAYTLGETADGGTTDSVPVNGLPATSPTLESGRGAEDSAINGTLLPGSDSEGAALRFELVQGSALNGSVTIDSETGAYTFMPVADFHGTASFQYVVSDGVSDSAAKTVTLTVTPVNDAPIAASAPESGTTPDGVPLSGKLLRGSDVDGDDLTFKLVTGSVENGSVTLSPSGDYTFTPMAGCVGPASFQYVMSDGMLGSPPKSVTITITAVSGIQLNGTSRNNILHGKIV
jgi:hypothetical protein